MSKRFDVCNGDADGLCATVQWRLRHPDDATLVTGLKRDIDLLARVTTQARTGDEVRVFDLSMQRNQPALRALLDAGVRVHYADHHDAGDVPTHPMLSAYIDVASDTCTSLIVDRLLDGAHRGWALVGAYGDNLRDVADRLAEASGVPREQRVALRQLGEAINYNAYGEEEADVCIAPATLFDRMLRHADPLAFVAEDPIVATLVRTREADMQEALRLAPHWQGEKAIVYLMPDKPWSRRVSGSFANAVARAQPHSAHAVLTPTRDGTHVVSVRAPLAAPMGADVLCRDFGGNGRARAAGIDALPAAEVPRFVQAFAGVSWGFGPCTATMGP
jgi:hypothetical protein